MQHSATAHSVKFIIEMFVEEKQISSPCSNTQYALFVDEIFKYEYIPEVPVQCEIHPRSPTGMNPWARAGWVKAENNRPWGK